MQCESAMPIQGLPYLRAKCIFVAAMERRASSPVIPGPVRLRYVRQTRTFCLIENEERTVMQLSSRVISVAEEPTVFPAKEAL